MNATTRPVSIYCDTHPDRIAVRYRAADKSRACKECVEHTPRKDQQ